VDEGLVELHEGREREDQDQVDRGENEHREGQDEHGRTSHPVTHSEVPEPRGARFPLRSSTELFRFAEMLVPTV